MRVHFIAIGGAAMHNLALALASKNYKVTGSDDEIFEPSLTRLADAGILPEEFGWFPDKIDNSLDAVILGMHARADNPELLKAQETGVKIYSYPEFLYEQTKSKKRVVIAGSHGKTTVTSMIMHVLKSAGIEFDYMAGAQIEGFDTMVSLKENTKIAVFEGDEYLTSPIDPRPKFHLYKPNIALINGIAWDHINVFPTFYIYCEQFRKFAEMIEQGGSLYYFGEDTEIKKIAENLHRPDVKIEKFYQHPFREDENNTELLLPEGSYISINVFGGHNMQNIAGAKLVCSELGVSDSDFYGAIASFTGSAKRLQKLYSDENTKIFLDFAHAPSKVTATVNAVKDKYPENYLIAFLELHTFSSLSKNFLRDYRGSMQAANIAIVYYNPEVIEHKKLEPLSVNEVEKAFGQENIIVIDKISELGPLLKRYKPKPLKTVLYMSSGNIGGVLKDDLVKFVQD